MSYLVKNVDRHEDWPGGSGPIQRLASRLDQLFREFEDNKFLLLYGPANAGKETFALSLIERWDQTRKEEHKAQPEKTVINCAKLEPGLGLAECSELDALWVQNSQPTPCLYCFLECQSVFNSLSTFLSDLITGRKSLKSVCVLLTATLSSPSERKSAIFEFAKNKRFAFLWYADKEMVKEVLVSAKKNVEGLDSHFAEAFKGELGSADMTRVREFIEAEENSVGEWICRRNERTRISRMPIQVGLPTAERIADALVQSRRIPQQVVPHHSESTKIDAEVSPGLPPSKVGLASLLNETAEQELRYLDAACLRRSGKPLQSLFVARSFRKISRPGESPRPDEKQWDEIIEEYSDLIILGDAGSGKTLQLLYHATTQLMNAQTQLRLDAPEDKIEFAFYMRAPELATQLLKTRKRLTDAAVRLLEESGRIPASVSPWILKMLQQGRGVLAIDALDELSESPPANGTQSARRVLMDSLSAHLTQGRRCSLVVSARKLGYLPDEDVILSQWELLPFTPSELHQAILRWIPESDWNNEFLEIVNNTPPFEEMLRVPVLLMLAAQIYREAFTSGNRGPALTRRVDFYQRLIDRYIRDWTRRAEDAGRSPNYTERNQFLPFVEGMGWYLWSSDPNRSDFSNEEIIDAINRSNAPPTLRHRDLLQDVCETGLVAKIDGPVASYEFLHRTLLEFLVALYLVRQVGKPGFTGRIWESIEGRMAPGKASVIVWMVAGMLQEPESLIDGFETWITSILANPLQDLSGSFRYEITEILVDCLFECQAGKVSRDKLAFAWELATRTLNRIQIRKRRAGSEWRQLAEFSLVYRVLCAADKHEGVGVHANDLINLIKKLRQTGEASSKEPPSSVVDLVKAVLKSTCPAARWVATWAVGASYERKWLGVATDLRSEVASVFRGDPDLHVRGIAGRVLVQIQDPMSYELLSKELDTDGPAAAGAAIAMGTLATDDALAALVKRADALLAGPPSESRNSLLNALVGALENILDNRHRRGVSTRNIALNKILIVSLNEPLPAVQASAASALGKLGLVEGWDALAKLLEAPMITQTANLRNSLCFACEQLTPRLAEQSQRDRATEIFCRVLSNRDEHVISRRSAAGALGRLAQHGRASPADIQLLLWGTQERSLAESCLFGLTRMPSNVVISDLVTLLKEDIQLRHIFCKVATDNPNRTGLEVLRWLLENDKRPSLQCSALGALGFAGSRVRRQTYGDYPDYENDAELLSQLTRICIDKVERKEGDNTVVNCSINALADVTLLRPFQAGEPLFSVTQRVRELARRLLEGTSTEFYIATVRLLGAVGEEPDVILLHKLREATESSKLRSELDSAARFLRRRLSWRSRGPGLTRIRTSPR